MSTHTVTKTTGWFERLGNSFKGILFGIVLFIAGSILLWWNEGNFVKTQVALKEAQGVTGELENINTVDTSRSGELVHAIGTAVTEDILDDPVFGISVNALRLNRDVEFYQWIEDSHTETKQKLGGGEEKTTTYSYRKDWVNNPVDSSRFHSPSAPTEHKNTVLASNVEQFSVQAKNVTFGAYRLPEFLVSSISGSESLPVQLSEEVTAKLHQQVLYPGSLPAPAPIPEPSTEQPAADAPAQGMLQFDEEEDKPAVVPATSPSSSMIHVSGSTVYFGQNPASPTVGDLRASFKQTKPSNEVSIVAKLVGDTFERYTAANGKPVGMLSVGSHSAESMYTSAHASNAMWTWILRVGGVFLVCMGLGMIVAPLSVIASVVPLVGKIVGFGTGVFSTMFGLAWSLFIIALAWLFYRPLIGIILLAAAVGLVVLLFTRKSSGKKENTSV